jgi:hypothetical protein
LAIFNIKPLDIGNDEINPKLSDFGNSAELEVGHVVLAFGTSFR